MSATEGTTPEAPNLALLRKLKDVAEAIPYVEKRGENTHHGYNFAQAVDVTRDVRTQLLARHVLVLPSIVPGSLRHFTETGGKSFVTTVDFVFRFVDTETAANVELTWAGAGADTGGDKGLYKAMTGALKYVLIGAFLLPMTNDPENDALSVQAPAAPEVVQGGGVAKDAERPAAPRIPVDRATLILDAALKAGLANPATGPDEKPTFTPVLKAKLATIGVEKLGALDVDQAEEVEAFIAAEAPEDVPVDGAA